MEWLVADATLCFEQEEHCWSFAYIGVAPFPVMWLVEARIISWREKKDVENRCGREASTYS